MWGNQSFFKTRLGSESASDVNGRCQNNSTCQFCHAILRWFIDELQHPSQELLQVLFCCFLTCKEILTKIIIKDEKSLHFLFKHPFCVRLVNPQRHTFRLSNSNKMHNKQAFREFLVSPALIRNYKAVISISFIWLQYLNQNCMKKLFRCLSSVCAARPYIW